MDRQKPQPAPDLLNWMNPLCWASNRYQKSLLLVRTHSFRNYLAGFSTRAQRKKFYYYQQQFLLQFWASILPSLVSLFASLFQHAARFLLALACWLARLWLYLICLIGGINSLHPGTYLLLFTLLPLWEFNSGYILMMVAWPFVKRELIDSMSPC